MGAPKSQKEVITMGKDVDPKEAAKHILVLAKAQAAAIKAGKGK